MKYVVAAAVAVAAVAAAGSQAAHAQSVLEALGPRAVGVGEALRAQATGSLATVLNPAGVALSRTYVIEGAYMYRPDDHANVQTVSLCDSVTSRVGACLFYDHLSATPDNTLVTDPSRSLHLAGVTVSAPLGEAFLIGVTQKYASYTDNANDANSHSGYGMDLGLIFKASPQLNLAAVGYNLIGDDNDQFARAIGGGLSFELGPKLLLAADGRYNLATSSGRYGGGMEYFFTGSDAQQGFPIRAGYVYDDGKSASYITGGLGFVTPRFGLDVGIRKQVSNGDEMMLQFGLRLFMPGT